MFSKEFAKARYLPMMIGNFAGLQAGVTLPIWLGASIDRFGIGESLAGWLGTVQLGMIAAASLLSSTRIDRSNRRRLGALGLGLSVVGNAVSIGAVGEGYLLLLFFGRAIAGGGEGMILAASNAAAASTPDPHRTYSLMNVVFALLAAMFFFLAPFAVAQISASGPFLLMIIISIAGLLTIRFLPPFVTEDAPPVAAAATSSRSFSALLGHGCAAACFVGIWAFVERAGLHNVGLNLEGVGMFLGVGALIGVLGPTASHILGTRIGRTTPIIITLTLYILVAFALGTVSSTPAYAIAVMSSNFLVFFFISYMMGLFAALDPTGRVPAAGPAFFSIGNAAGPVLIGSGFAFLPGFTALGWIGGALCIIAMFLILPAALNVDRSKKIKERL